MEHKVILSILVVAFLAASEAAPQKQKSSGHQLLGHRPVEGEECDPDECVLDGDCLDYWWCDREASDHKGTGKKGHWRFDKCDEKADADNMYWNPKGDHSGTCDWWDNLDAATKDKYNKDENCIDPHCEWRAQGDCSNSYWYFHPVKTDGKEVELHCPRLPDGEELVWSQDRKSCHHCTQVNKADGSACC